MIYSSTNEIVPLCDVTSPIVVRMINVCFVLFIVRRIVYFVKNCIIYLVFRMFTLVKLIYLFIFFMNIYALVGKYLFHLYIVIFFYEIKIIFHLLPDEIHIIFINFFFSICSFLYNLHQSRYIGILLWRKVISLLNWSKGLYISI